MADLRFPIEPFTVPLHTLEFWLGFCQVCQTFMPAELYYENRKRTIIIFKSFMFLIQRQLNHTAPLRGRIIYDGFSVR